MPQRVRALAAVVLVAVLATTALVLVSSSQSEEPPSPTATADTSHLRGIPQDGPVLGDPDAKLRIVEVADLQCPFCRDAARTTVREVIDGAVERREARIELRDLAFLGPDSIRLAEAAAAAGLQDRYWDAVEALYARQGTENSGYATDDFLRDALSTVEGLDVDRAMDDRDDPQVSRWLQEARTFAQQHGVTSTPTFLVSENGGPLREVTQEELLELAA